MSDNPYKPPESPQLDPNGNIGFECASHVRWIIFFLACLTSFLTYVHRYSWGVVRPYVKEDAGLNDADLGWLDAAFSLTYALGQFPGGLAGDLFGPRLMIPLFAIVWSLVVAGPALFPGFWRLLGVRLIFGATQAPAYPNLGKITKTWFPISIRTTLQGMVASFSGRLGGAVAPAIIATLLIGALGMTWQYALYALASSGIVFAIIFWALFRNQPSEHPWSNEAERKLVEEGETISGGTQDYRFRWTSGNILNLLLFSCASFLSTGADNLFVFYMPTFLVEAKGFSVAEMGVFAGLPILGGAIGGMCGGVLNDVLIRVSGNRRVARSFVSSSGKTLAALLLVASLFVEDGRIVMFILFGCKFFSDWSQPTWWGTVTDIGGPAAGRVFGMVNTMGSLGGTTIAVMMGYMKEYFGWNGLFLCVAGIYVLTAIFWGFVNCTKTLVESVPSKSDDAAE